MKRPAEHSDGSASTGAPNADRRTLLQSALEAIERLQSRLDAAESTPHEPIAIVGLGCRIPGGVVDARSYWELLCEGRDVVGEIPPERWNVDAFYDPDPAALGKARTKAGGFLDDIFGFEPGFFGMSPREATGLDPQQRLLLEVAWEALENAAIPADRLDGSRTGVFIGITSTDYAQRIDVADPARSDIYLATGTALNAAAGRVSFTLGLQGPCMAIDTACSSSLVAIHTACQSLRNRESNLALAGGVNAILTPEPYVLISKWGMLSPDGRCKAFDASANGFVRSEGCGLIVLERLSDAIANGRQVIAVIRGSAINQDGRSSGLTVPNGIAQQAVLRQALAAAKLQPTDVSYVEAHGTGTSLGDPIEVEALAAVYGQGRDMAQPFEIGSVKSNLGHLEAAAGVTGLIKVVLAMQHGCLPASLHVQQPTPAIPWERLPVRVCTTLHDWAPPGGVRRAGVSAFGFSGMNAHVIVEQAPALPAAPPAQSTRPLHLLVLSARSEAALAALAERHAAHLEQIPSLPLEQVCATLAVGRAHFNHRLAVLAPDSRAMAARLRAARAKGAPVQRGQSAAGTRLRIAFLFTGQGSQQVGMGRELDQTEPVFRQTLDRCAAVLDPLLARPLRDLLFMDTGGQLDQTGNTQPALFALEVSLAALWRSWGVEPSVVIGHSVGEYAAAVVAGVLSLEDGARLIAARGRLMQALPAGGAMVAVQGDIDVVERAVAAQVAQVAIAARNAPGQVVIAGVRASVDAIAAQLAAQGLRTQALTVSHAFHSPLMAPMLAGFHRIAAAVPHEAPRIGWISNLGGTAMDWPTWGPRMADYWTRHVRDAVAFEASMLTLTAQGIDACVEIGPGSTLIGLARQTIDEDERIAWIASLRRSKPVAEQLLDGLASLYVRGARLAWEVIGGGAPHSLRLPTYPFQRQRFLVEPRQNTRRATGPAVHPLLGARISVAGVIAQFECSVRADDPAWLADHHIAGETLMPMTAYLEAALAAARQVRGGSASSIEAIEAGAPMILRNREELRMQVVVDEPGAGTRTRVRIFSRDSAREDEAWTLHASAEIPLRTSDALHLGDATACTRSVDVAELYERMRGLGFEFGPSFRILRSVRCGDGEAVGKIEAPASLGADAEHHLLHPALLDASFHVAAVAIESLRGADDGRIYLPVGVERYRWFGTPGATLVSHARVRAPHVHGEALFVDIRIETPDGRAVAELTGLRCQRVSGDLFRQRSDALAAEWLYGIAWLQAPAAVDAPMTGRWLVLDDGCGRGERLAEEIVQRGGRVLRVAPDAALDPALFTAEPLTGVVSLWPLRVPALAGDLLPSTVQHFGTEAALQLVQVLAAAPAPLWLVTSGVESVDGGETPCPEQAPVAGLARVAALEHPELQVTHVDLDAPAPVADMRTLADLLAAGPGESRVALRKGIRHVARLERMARPSARRVDDAPTRLAITERGTLENLAIVPAQRRAPGPGEIELRVRASGLNFRDVLAALGLYPGEIRQLGSDCAGEVVTLGAGVHDFVLGDRVVAMTEGAFASHATTRAAFVAPLPAGLGFELGASIVTAYLTAEITLNQIARMKARDRVLIHAGAGGVGMAAIALARRAGAEIFATAGSSDKRAVLTRLGVQHVLDSRSPAFADELLRITAGRGVDIVLNSLTGAMLDRSFEVLANGGIFLEIGKRDLWTHAQAEQLGRGIRYHIVDCNDYARDTPALVGETFRRVLAEIAAGVLPLLPCTTFALERAPEAFRYMAQARHTGRVVFRHSGDAPRLETPVRGDATYIVTGGTRGLGLVAARWLADEGAKHLLLAARSEPDADARETIATLVQAGVSVRTVAADVGSEAGVESLMDVFAAGSVPLGGVLHGAAVLDDGVLLRQSPERFATVMAAKADGAWLLHRALQRRGLTPDFFVMHSSMSAVFGSPGQGNYVAANAFLDVLARHRRVQGLPATSIAWGAWKDVGMAARGGTTTRLTGQGFEALAPTRGMHAMGLLLRDGAVGAAVAPIDWPRVAQHLGDALPPALLQELLTQTQRHAAGPLAITTETIDYTTLPAEQRLARIATLVRRELALVLALPNGHASIVDDEPFSSFGLDSLSSVELRNRLQRALGRPVAASAMFEWPSVAQLTGHLSGLFLRSADASAREEVTL